MKSSMSGEKPLFERYRMLIVLLRQAATENTRPYDILRQAPFWCHLLAESKSSLYNYLNDLPSLDPELYRHLIFLKVVLKNISRLCGTKPIVTVNKQFPGPTLYAREGDRVLVKVVNHVKYNLSIHWKIRDGLATEFKHSAAIPSLIFQDYMHESETESETEIMISVSDSVANQERIRDRMQKLVSDSVANQKQNQRRIHEFIISVSDSVSD
ncbi:hypothetical protein Syun_028461 [Stephania yunnanensis]|uniref:Plastocyanin-like domain-containing protein n=1 Tax=Stephania yunnanensis TaxID=152371 RepID=A0AAP0EHE4_9MAGN